MPGRIEDVRNKRRRTGRKKIPVRKEDNREEIQ